MKPIELIKICHLTSKHKINDTRIFRKQCVSLAKHNYDVTLIGFDVKLSSFFDNNVNLITIPYVKPLFFFTFLKRVHKIYKYALECNAQIYHLHDPELLILVIFLKLKNKIVIFDSHEDVPRQILEKKNFPHFVMFFISFIYEKFEKYILKYCDLLIAPSCHIMHRLKRVNPNTIQVTNYPLFNINEIDLKWEKSICFAGGITNQWSHQNIINAIDNIPNITYNICGNFESQYFNKLSLLKSWNKVKYFGFIEHKEIPLFISKSSIGMALNNYNRNVGGKLGSIGNTKLFEYMNIGIPVICTDFILWKEVIDKYNCGICVNPNNIEEITNSINFLLKNLILAKEMGNNGRNAIRLEYNWATQEKILLNSYKLLNI
jgi:glycosyltransferase involved in cell wall biosynthesis